MSAAPFIKAALLLLQVILTPGLLAQDTEWVLRRDRNAIQIYTTEVPDSPYDKVRTVTVVEDLRLSAVVALITDTAACPEWAKQCVESRVVEQLSPTESYIYTHNDLPFPARDRDVIARVRWYQNPDTLEVTMVSEAISGILPETQGLVRVTDARATWTFTPLAEGRLEIASEAHVDPGSVLPGWVVNSLLVNTPYETVLSLVQAARESPYAEAEIHFITEPGVAGNRRP